MMVPRRRRNSSIVAIDGECRWALKRLGVDGEAGGRRHVAIDGECRWALKQARRVGVGGAVVGRNRRRMPMGIETIVGNNAWIGTSQVAIDGECRWALKPDGVAAIGDVLHGRNRRRMPMGIETLQRTQENVA